MAIPCYFGGPAGRWCDPATWFLTFRGHGEVTSLPCCGRCARRLTGQPADGYALIAIAAARSVRLAE